MILHFYNASPNSLENKGAIPGAYYFKTYCETYNRNPRGRMQQ